MTWYGASTSPNVSFSRRSINVIARWVTSMPIQRRWSRSATATVVAVAERLHRRWIGIDVTHLAITLMERRLKDAFRDELAPYLVVGDPKDLGGARALAESNRHQFEWWALSLVEAKPAQDKKKGSDKGIDGYINFFDD